VGIRIHFVTHHTGAKHVYPYDHHISCYANQPGVTPTFVTNETQVRFILSHTGTHIFAIGATTLI